MDTLLSVIASSRSRASAPELTSVFLVSKSNGLYYSQDGHTLNQINTTLPDSYYSVQSDNKGTFYSTSNNGTIIRKSTDLVNWAVAYTFPVGVWGRLRYVNNRLFLMRSDTPQVATSTDGVNWQVSDLPTGTWREVAYGNGVYVTSSYAVRAATNTTILDVARSTDGVTWTGVHTQIEPLTATTRWAKVTFVLGKFVLSASGPISFIATSTDGLVWSKLVYSGMNLRTVYATNNQLALALGSASSYFYSTNLVTWTTSTRKAQPPYLFTAVAAYSSDLGLFMTHDYLTSSSGGNLVWENAEYTSPDGLAWAEHNYTYSTTNNVTERSIDNILATKIPSSLVQ